MAVLAKMMIARIASRTKTIAVPESRSIRVLYSEAGSLGDQDEHQFVDAPHAAALSLVERPMVFVARVPGRAAQFGLSDAASANVVERNRDFSHELVDRHLLWPQRFQEGIAKQGEQSDRQCGEQEPLYPHLGLQSHQLKSADQQRRQAEENQVEAAGRHQLEPRQREPEHQPEPPGHKGRLLKMSRSDYTHACGTRSAAGGTVRKVGQGFSPADACGNALQPCERGDRGPESSPCTLPGC